MIEFFRKRPWIWVIIAFVILITGWVFLLRLSITHRPESIPVESIPVESIEKSAEP